MEAASHPNRRLHLGSSVIVLIASFLTGCDLPATLFEPENVEPPPPIPEAKGSVPVAATDLPVNHRIQQDDIVFVEMTAAEMRATEWPLNEVMMSAEWIEGRVLRSPLAVNSPFLTSDLYLEGTEPGAPPEPEGTTDPPWPSRSEIVLLVDKLEEMRASAEGVPPVCLLPVALTYLPEGRRLRKSDITFVPMTTQMFRDRPMPDFQVLVDPEQFVGRRLRRNVVRNEEFMLADFELNEELQAYLDSFRK